MEKKSPDPFLHALQDLINERYGLESWPSPTAGDCNAIDIKIDSDVPSIISIAVGGTDLIVYRPFMDRPPENSPTISMFDRQILGELWKYIDEAIDTLDKAIS